ncbi:MAG: ATPase, T2SS/T4P/T4SS family [Chloroflexota bacterium]
MSLLRRIENNKSPQLLRLLLETLFADDTLRPAIDAHLQTLADELDLSDDDRAQLDADPVTYLLRPTEYRQSIPQRTRSPFNYEALMQKLKAAMGNAMLDDDRLFTLTDETEKQQRIREIFEPVYFEVVSEESVLIERSEKERIYEAVMADIDRFSVLNALLLDHTISEIHVHGPDAVFVMRDGRSEKLDRRFFRDSETLHEFINQFARHLLNTDTRHLGSTVEAQMPEGHRVHIIQPPTVPEPNLSIIKTSVRLPDVHTLIAADVLPPQIADFLRGAVIAGLNIVVAGEQRFDTTAMLNVLANFIPAGERTAVMEGLEPLALEHDALIPLRLSMDSVYMEGRDLLRAAMVARPAHIVATEHMFRENAAELVRSGIHYMGAMAFPPPKGEWQLSARSAANWLARMTGGAEGAPQREMRLHMLGASVDMLVVLRHNPQGSWPQVAAISQIEGVENSTLVMSDIFEGQFTAAGQWHYRATRVIPRAWLNRMEMAGIHVPPSVFSMDTGRS